VRVLWVSVGGSVITEETVPILAAEDATDGTNNNNNNSNNSNNKDEDRILQHDFERECSLAAEYRQEAVK
jgi:hypothetical protein